MVIIVRAGLVPEIGVNKDGGGYWPEALGCNSDSYIAGGQHVSALEDYARLGTAPGLCHHCHTGKCPVGVTTQDTGPAGVGAPGVADWEDCVASSSTLIFLYNAKKRPNCACQLPELTIQCCRYEDDMIDEAIHRIEEDQGF